jgi:cardiolipin synthase
VGILIAGNFFTEGKKLKQLVKASYAVGDDAFVRSMSNLLGPPLLGGNRVQALQNGAEIFPAMLEAIRGARETITFENFIFWEGRVSRLFSEALSERARAGVRVHMLQDAMGCDSTNGPDIRRMQEAGVELELYRFFHLTRMNQRTHRKLLVIDGKVGFTGGVGIGDKWDGNGDRPGHWRDTQYRLEGPAVAQMQQAFMDNWMQTQGCILHGDDYFPLLADVGDDVCQVFKSSADEGSDSARLMMMLSIAAARKTVHIANAYFIPDRLMIDTLVDARRRGVEVEIIVPGEQIDQSWVRWVSRARWKPLLKSGVRIYEFQPTNFHCKYMIVDRCWSSVGSANLDNRSLRLNEECNLNVLDKEFAEDQARVFEGDKSRSREVALCDWERRSFAEHCLARGYGLLSEQM